MKSSSNKMSLSNSSSSSSLGTTLLLAIVAVLLAPTIATHVEKHPHHHHHHGSARNRWQHPADQHRHFHLKHAHGKFKPGPWKLAHATFYGGSDGSGTRGGACGFEDTVEHRFGLNTAALSSVMFDDGLKCGACYQIKCISDKQRHCKRGNPSVVVTATNVCPPNLALPSDNGGWCNPPREHFDLSQPAYLKIAEYHAGIVPISYRRVPCQKRGGIRFTITGSKYYTEVFVWNVAGAGDVHGIFVKGVKQQWTPLTQVWGQRWKTNVDLTGQSLTFRVLTGDGRKSTAWHITPNEWQYGQTYVGKNFLH